MADVLSPKQRSYNMSRIRGRDTKPELKLRKALWVAGLRYRIKSKLPGRPDLVFPSVRVAVFLDGCFWHGCPEHATAPETRADFWRRKLAQNRDRDITVNMELRKLGWLPCRVWEHAVKGRTDDVVQEIANLVAARRAHVQK